MTEGNGARTFAGIFYVSIIILFSMRYSRKKKIACAGCFLFFIRPEINGKSKLLFKPPATAKSAAIRSLPCGGGFGRGHFSSCGNSPPLKKFPNRPNTSLAAYCPLSNSLPQGERTMMPAGGLLLGISESSFPRKWESRNPNAARIYRRNRNPTDPDSRLSGNDGGERRTDICRNLLCFHYHTLFDALFQEKENSLCRLLFVFQTTCN